jgi:Family of unknown function (DUF5694)
LNPNAQFGASQSGTPANMRSSIIAFLLVGFCSHFSAQSLPKPDSATVQVLVLGTYHFGNPGLDQHNLRVDSVLTPEKQTELADVAMRLAKFKPTKIAVEALPDRSDFSLTKFDEFSPDKLNTTPDERVQIGYRLGRLVGHRAVYGIDEQSDTIDYFPYDKVDALAKANGQADQLARVHEVIDKKIQAMEEAQKVNPVRVMLADLNEPAAVHADHTDFYYPLLLVGNQKEQAGADLNAPWYQRNAKIFTKLTRIAKPGDRIVVLFGSGHSFWLRHFVQNTPGFDLVEPNPFLR